MRAASRRVVAAAGSGGESGGAAGGAGPSGQGDGLAAVAERLSEAVAAEDYEKAAALRDELS